MPGVVAETSKSLQETKNQRRRRLERERKQQNVGSAIVIRLIVANTC